MSQQQGRVTDNLASIIQRIQFERRTGELHVKRIDGPGIEQGSITFIDGRAVRAQLGTYQEAVAFDRLRTWKQCIFIFVLHSGGTYQLPAPSQTPPPQNNLATKSRSFDGFLPSQTQPLDSLSPSNIHTPLPQNSPSPRSTWTQPLEGLSPTTRNTTGPLESDKQHSLPAPSTPIPLIAIPRATMSVVKAIGMINKAGLPKTCRQILLLIDGRHSVSEIIGLAGISSDETTRALYALETLGVITLAKPG